MVGRQLMIPQLTNGRIPPWCSLLLSHGETYHPVPGQFFVSSRCIAQISRVGLHLPRALQCKMARDHPAQLQPLASNCIQPLARLNFHLKVVWSELPSACVYCVPSYFSFWSQLFSIECFFFRGIATITQFWFGSEGTHFWWSCCATNPVPFRPFQLRSMAKRGKHRGFSYWSWMNMGMKWLAGKKIQWWGGWISLPWTLRPEVAADRCLSFRRSWYGGWQWNLAKVGSWARYRATSKMDQYGIDHVNM